MACFDLGTGVVEYTGSLEVDYEHPGMALDANFDFAVVREHPAYSDERSGSLFDARTGELLRPIEDFSGFLHDGRVLRVIRDGHDAKRIVVENLAGETVVSRNLSDIPRWWIVGEGLPGHLMLEHSCETLDGESASQVDLVNLETGNTKTIGDRLRPVRVGPWAYGSGWYRRNPSGQRLFWKGPRMLVRWDPETGDLGPVIAAQD